MATTNRPRTHHLPIWGSMDHPWPPTTTTTPPQPPLGALKPTRSARCTKKRRTSQSGSVFYTPKPLRRATARLSGPRYGLFVNFRPYSGKDPKDSHLAWLTHLEPKARSHTTLHQKLGDTHASLLRLCRTWGDIQNPRGLKLEAHKDALLSMACMQACRARCASEAQLVYARIYFP